MNRRFIIKIILELSCFVVGLDGTAKRTFVWTDEPLTDAGGVEVVIALQLQHHLRPSHLLQTNRTLFLTNVHLLLENLIYLLLGKTHFELGLALPTYKQTYIRFWSSMPRRPLNPLIRAIPIWLIMAVWSSWILIAKAFPIRKLSLFKGTPEICQAGWVELFVRQWGSVAEVGPSSCSEFHLNAWCQSSG